MKGHSWRTMKFPAIVAVMKHPRLGNVLFDTGYAKRFLEETENFPNRFYRMLTPMHLCDKENLINQLNADNLAKDDINYIFISHFHADHISGLLDFPKAQFICSKQAFDSFNNRSGIGALMKGYIKALLPADFLHRVTFIEDSPSVNLPKSLYPFQFGYDIFADGSYIAIELPGHAYGHFGLLVNQNDTVNFLIGDACWTKEAYQFGIRPNILTSIIMSDGDKYRETLDNLSTLYGRNMKIRIIPSHCQKTFEAITRCTSI